MWLKILLVSWFCAESQSFQSSDAAATLITTAESFTTTTTEGVTVAASLPGAPGNSLLPSSSLPQLLNQESSSDQPPQHQLQLQQEISGALKQGLIEDGSGTDGGCTCVAYYLCPNGTVLTDGTGLLDIRAKPGVCEDFMDVCCANPLDPDKPIKPVTTKRQGCGFRHPEGIGFRITGATDNEAQFGEFPWMVAILKTGTSEGENVLLYQCGGALIHETIVLTAAHCVKAQRVQDLTVRAGEWDTQRENEIYPHRDVKVSEILVHPEYSSGSLWNDFALVFLQEPLPLGQNIDTVCLPEGRQSNEEIGQVECFASGWGKDTFGEEGKSQVILKKVELPLVSHDRCQDYLRETRLGKYFKLHRSFVCAGGVKGKDTCKGDGGSPLVCPIPSRPGMYEVTGIVSWGIGCGGEIPGVYASVPYARPWIDEQLAKFRIQLE